MTWLQFIVQMIGHVAWPLTVVVIALQFKNELRQFIARIRNAKFGGAELDLAAEIQQVKQSAESAGITVLYDSSAFLPDSVSILDTAPELAFIKSWQEVERQVVSIYQPFHAGTIPSRPSIVRMIKVLLKEGLIDASLGSVVTQLYDTRNRVVHESGHAVTRGEALEWLGISKSVADRLRQVAERAAS